MLNKLRPLVWLRQFRLMAVAIVIVTLLCLRLLLPVRAPGVVSVAQRGRVAWDWPSIDRVGRMD